MQKCTDSSRTHFPQPWIQPRQELKIFEIQILEVPRPFSNKDGRATGGVRKSR